jgi:hypothetical protein
MADGNILIRCPGCGKAQSVVMAVGQQLQCGVCQTVFFAPVLAPDQLPPTTTSESFSVEPASTSPALPPGRQAAIGAQMPIPLSETRPIERAAASRNWRTDGMELEPPAATGPRFEPQGDMGRGAGPSAAPREPRGEHSGGGKIWTVVTVAAGLIIVAASLLVGIHFVWNGRQVADEPAGNPRPAPVPAASPVHTAQFYWTDATQHAQRLGQLELKVVRAKYGAVRAKDVNNEVITTDDSNLLAVTVSVHNRGAQPRAFRSWYAGGFESEEGEELLPELSDDMGRAYDLLRFDDVSSIEGQRLADEIEPRHDVQDTVVFLVPADVDRTKIRYFRLSLPAHAIGTVDFFRFEIPVGMIIDF